jgi:hypothetical protein
MLSTSGVPVSGLLSTNFSGSSGLAGVLADFEPVLGLQAITRVIEKHKMADNRRNFIISLTSIWREHGIIYYAQQGMKNFKTTQRNEVFCVKPFFFVKIRLMLCRNQVFMHLCTPT